MVELSGVGGWVEWVGGWGGGWNRWGGMGVLE